MFKFLNYVSSGWQNQGYACYIVTRTYTEKVGLIDWRIGKGKKEKKRKGKKEKENEEKRKKTTKKQAGGTKDRA